MFYKSNLVRILDRPGGRWLLGRAASQRFRRRVGKDVEVRFIDGRWTRRVGASYLLDGGKFEYLYADANIWGHEFERYEKDTRDFWLQNYSPVEGDTIVDVGAGRGEDVLTFSRTVGVRGRVIAIEAHPGSFATMKSFCKLNGLKNVVPIHAALMDKAGVVGIQESEESWQEHAVFKNGRVGVSVRATTLPEICGEYEIKRIDFLKMNIEGAERFALLGMDSNIRIVKQICVACHDFRAELGHGDGFRTRDFVTRFLTEQGFQLASRANDPRDYVRDHVFGVRQS